jgi:hypothetical protein
MSEGARLALAAIFGVCRRFCFVTRRHQHHVIRGQGHHLPFLHRVRKSRLFARPRVCQTNDTISSRVPNQRDDQVPRRRPGDQPGVRHRLHRVQRPSERAQLAPLSQPPSQPVSTGTSVHRQHSRAVRLIPPHPPLTPPLITVEVLNRAPATIHVENFWPLATALSCRRNGQSATRSPSTATTPTPRSRVSLVYSPRTRRRSSQSGFTAPRISRQLST